MESVLVLNATYEPLSVVSQRRAVVLLLKEKAELLEATERHIRAAHYSLPAPLVIRLVYYVRVPRRATIPVTRRTVFMRDNYICQYCGHKPSKSELTIDHVLPKVRGGRSTWDNLVCACQKCNLRKGARTPEEANMPLLRKPEKPRYVAIAFLSQASDPDTWEKYIPPA